MTGDKSLTFQMGPNGGVQELDIYFQPTGDIKWIPVASLFLKLRFFSVTLSSNPFSYMITGMNLHWLSKSLLVLRLKFPNVFDELLIPNTTSGDIRYHSIRDHFPQLEELTLDGNTKYYKELFDVLPKTLLELHLTAIMDDSVSYTVIDKLPRSIVRLTLMSPTQEALKAAQMDLGMATAKATVSFPPNLEYLKLHASWGLMVSHCYPRHLTWLDARYAQYERIPVDFVSLPPNLLHYETSLKSVKVEDIAKLPRTLTELRLGWDTVVPSGDELLEALPPCLTNCSLLSDREAVMNYRKLPRTLKYLDLYNELNTGTLEDLPKTLERLSVEAPIGDADLAKLPRNLKIFLAPLYGPIKFESFPGHLRILRVGSVARRHAIIEALPRTLATLDLPWPFVSPSNGALLRDLTHLETLNLLELPTDEIRQGMVDSALDVFLPPSLTSFSTKFLPVSWTRSFQSLPCARVLHLPFGMAAAINADLAFFKSLPPSLQILSVFSHTTFDRECIMALPPLLASLRISLETIPAVKEGPSFDFDNADIALLPKFLRSLSLTGPSRITHEASEYATPFLTLFQVSTRSGVTNFAKRRISPFTPASAIPKQ
jgi:hypothetical protein